MSGVLFAKPSEKIMARFESGDEVPVSDFDALCRAVLDAPEQDTPRLVLANYCDDHDMPDMAAALRKPHFGSPFKSLIGRTVRYAQTDGDNLLFLDTNQGPLTYTAEGDCCSVSWFYAFLGVKNLVGQTVLAVGELDDSEMDVDTDDGLCRQESDAVYGYRIITAKGLFDVIFRCSSNGYYGGWLHVSQEDSHNTTIWLDDDWVATAQTPEVVVFTGGEARG